MWNRRRARVKKRIEKAGKVVTVTEINPAIGPHKRGYVFVGWSTQDGERCYPLGSDLTSVISYSANEVHTARIGKTLYPIWQEKPPEEPEGTPEQ